LTPGMGFYLLNIVVPFAWTSRSLAVPHPPHPPHKVAAATSSFSLARAMMQLPIQTQSMSLVAVDDVTVDGECVNHVGHPCCQVLVSGCFHNFDVWTSVHLPRGCVFVSVRGLIP
jgi:hypothetical protein